MRPITNKSISYECCELCHADYGKMLDYCAKCGKNLCAKHMAEGHCGEVPALSGNLETEKWMQEHAGEMYEKAKATAPAESETTK